MRRLFFAIIMITMFCIFGCNPYGSWEVLGDCTDSECAVIGLSIERAYELKDQAQVLFKQNSPESPFTIAQALHELRYTPFMCGQPYNDRISEQVLLSVYPNEIMINESVFDLDSDGDEDRVICSLAATLTHAGGHVAAPEIDHECQVEVDNMEACPPDQLAYDPVYEVGGTMHLTCLDY